MKIESLNTKMKTAAKILGFVDYDKNSFIRRNVYETSYLYLFENKTWEINIISDNNEKDSLSFHSSETIKTVKTPEDILSVLCDWYMGKGMAIAKAHAVQIAKDNVEKVYNIYVKN